MYSAFNADHPSYYNFINDALPKIAKELESPVNLLTVVSHDACIISNVSFPIFSINKHSNIISRHGLSNRLPFITLVKRLFYEYDGFLICETKSKSKIRYAILSITTNASYGEYSFIKFVITKKGDLCKVLAHVRSTTRQEKEKSDVPILEKEIIDNVYDNTIGFLLKIKSLPYKIPLRRGIFLSGPPGNGKTMLCKWLKDILNNKGIAYRSVSAGDLDKNYIKSFENIFDKPIVFFDDIDIKFFSRVDNSKQACALLAAMDGLDNSVDTPSVRIFTTNEELSSVDPAFLRPGRIDKCFEIKPPTSDLRLRLVKERWHKDVVNYLEKEDQIGYLIEVTKEKSFADMQAIYTSLILKNVDTGKWDIRGSIEEFNSFKSTNLLNDKPFGFGA